MWSKFTKALGFRGEKEHLTPEMCAEIDRLGLDRGYFQWLVDEEGLKFGQFALSRSTEESQLFDRWHPRLLEFVEAKRRQSPLADRGSLGVLETATTRILEPKIRDAERVPCRGNHTAAIFTAPLHVLPIVVSEWPSAYRHPVFMTPDELTEWQSLYKAEESDQESWWYVFQNWDAQCDPPPDAFWLQNIPVPPSEGSTAVLIGWGLCWGALAGGYQSELWEVDGGGNERFLQDVDDLTY